MILIDDDGMGIVFGLVVVLHIEVWTPRSPCIFFLRVGREKNNLFFPNSLAVLSASAQIQYDCI